MSEPPKSLASDDEIETTWRKFVEFPKKYANTVRAVYVSPYTLFNSNGNIRSSAILPPLEFFGASFAMAVGLEGFAWPAGPSAYFEVPGIAARMKAALDILPLSVPLVATVALFLGVIVPWIILRPFSAKLSFRRLFYIYCYQQGGITFPFAALVAVYFGTLTSTSFVGADFLIIDFGPALVWGVGLYSLVWLSKRIAEESSLSRYAVGIALCVTSLILTAVEDAYGPNRSYLYPSQGMIPSIEPLDRILVNRWIYSVRAPKRGEIIVFYPDEEHQSVDLPFVFRVIGIGGDVIELIEGNLFVNQKKVTMESSISRKFEDHEVVVRIEKLGGSEYETFEAGSGGRNQSKMVVPDEHVYVLGDNRNYAKDSRYLGSIPFSRVIGPIYYRFLPSSKAGPL